MLLKDLLESLRYDDPEDVCVLVLDQNDILAISSGIEYMQDLIKDGDERLMLGHVRDWRIDICHRSDGSAYVRLTVKTDI